jgi:hypothetical protein
MISHTTLLIPQVFSKIACEVNTNEVNMVKIRKSIVPTTPSQAAYIVKHPEIIGKMWNFLYTERTWTSLALPVTNFVLRLYKKIKAGLGIGINATYEVQYAPEETVFEVECEPSVEEEEVYKTLRKYKGSETRVLEYEGKGCAQAKVLIYTQFKECMNVRAEVMIPMSEVNKVRQFIKDLTREGIEPNPGPQRRRNQNKRGRGRRRNRGEERETRLMQRTTIPRGLQRNSPFPPFMYRRLTYVEPNFVLQNPLSPFVIRELRINSAFDPDVLVGGESMQGFVPMTYIYEFYRVEKIRFRYDISGNETFPQTVGIILKDRQPSTVVTTFNEAISSLEIQPSTGPNVVGQNSGNAVYRSRWHSISMAAVLGDRLHYLADTGYSAATNADPNQIIWMAMIAIAPTAILNLTNGVIINLRVEALTKFFSLRNADLAPTYEEAIDNSRRLRDFSQVLNK